MKKLSTFLIVILCLNITNAQQESLCSPKIYTFQYDVPGTPADKVNTLANLGLDGMIFQVKNNTISLINEYKNVNQVANGSFNIYSIYYTLNLNKAVNYKKITNIYNKLRNTDILLQVIFTGSPSQSSLEQTVSRIADIAASKGKELVIYPHDNTRILSVDDALAVIEAVNKPNVFLAVHLAHVLRAGNGNNVAQVVNNASPYLKIATISGATLSEIGSGTNWNDVVKPLGQGTYDILPFYEALHNVGFKGPIGIHSFGLLQNYNLTVQQHIPPAIDVINGFAEQTCGSAVINDISDLAITDVECDNVTLSWSDAGAEDAYRISRRLIGGNYSILGELPANSNNYTDNSVSEQLSYNYLVEPLKDGAPAATSNTLEVTTPACTTQTSEYIFIDHKSSNKRLKANNSGGAVGVKVATATGNQVQWQELDAGNGYFYLVHKASGKKLNASNNGNTINTLPAGNTANGAQWRWIDAGNDWYRLENKQFNKWLHVKANGTTDFLLGPTSWMGDNTRWKITNVAGNKSVHSANTTSKELLLFPNPAHELINIELKNIEKASLEVINFQGKSLLFKGFVGTAQLETSKFGKGTFILKITTTNQVITKIFVVE